MLKVECEACKAPYQVDERRVPPTGLKMRCPKCGHAFTVTNPDAGAAPAPMPVSKHTIMGVAAVVAPPPVASGDIDLPERAAPKPAAAKPAAPKPAPPKTAAKPAPLPAAPGLGEIDELMDLPAMPAPGLPAVVKPLPAVKPTLVSHQSPPTKAPAPARPATVIPSLDDFDIDLPSPTADLPARQVKPAARGPADLPATKPAKPLAKPPPPPAVGGALFDDLPMPAGSGMDLPMAKGGKPPPFADLPSTRDNVGLPAARDNVGLPAARDNIGLPAARDNIGLPAAFGEIGLPAPRDNVGLPAAFGDIGLPAPMDGGFGAIDFPAIGGALPMAASSLPATVDQGNYLPRASGAGAHLPSAMGGNAHLPAVANALPSAVHDNQFLPSSTGSDIGFGEADFGDLGAPPEPAGGAAAPRVVSGGQGGVGFGELDFGAGGDVSAVEADVSAAPTSMREAGGEAALPTDEPRAKTRDRVVINKGQGRLAKIVVAGGAAVFLAGASLGLTRYGLFGWHIVSDFSHKGQWTAEANGAMAKTRKIIGADLYDQTRAASDAISAQSTASPRSQSLIAAAALAEYEFQVRYGRDAARATRADGWLKSIAEANGKPESIPFYAAAAAGRAAAMLDPGVARALLEAASQKDTGDPVQEDIAFLRGELELKAKDAAAATKAFSRALQIAPSARAHYGLARSYILGPDRAKVLVEIAATLAATPNHPGALILKAAIDWADDRSDSAVIDGLKPLLDGPAKATASAAELSRAYTLYGLAQASRGDVGAARTAFEAALKLDSTNGEALLGQGEVFFADGRYTEALSRFDTAVQADPTNPGAIIADAKAKLALERLSDAKTQLAAAQKAMPKDPQLTYWLGRAEEAIGNKKGAEEAYVGAIGLMTLKDRDAIQPYVALSTLLAGQGRASEASARLNEARAKLPDSAAMQRALGEVAAAQGLFDEAVGHYQSAATKDPHDLRSLFLLGETYLRMRRLDEATAQFDKVAAADRDYPNLAMRRGELLEQSGHVDQALQQFKAALDRAPKDLDLQLRVGAAYVGIGRGEDAYKILKPVYDERNNSAEVNHYLGRALLLEGGAHLVEAKRYLAKAVDVEPTRAQYHLYLAWVGTESQDWKLAEIEVGKAIALDQLSGDAYWQRAVIEEVHGAVDDAIKDATRALELHPSRIEAHATLAKCYADKNLTEKALAEWSLATSHGTEHPDWEFLFGRLLYDHGNIGQAKAHVLAAAKAGENMQPTPIWLAQVEYMTASALLKEGNKVDAKEHFIRFMDTAELSNPDRRDAVQALKSIDPEYRYQPK